MKKGSQHMMKTPGKEGKDKSECHQLSSVALGGLGVKEGRFLKHYISVCASSKAVPLGISQWMQTDLLERDYANREPVNFLLDFPTIWDAAHREGVPPRPLAFSSLDVPVLRNSLSLRRV